MLKEIYTNYLGNLIKENSLLKFVIIAQCIAIVCFGYLTLRAVKHEKVVIVPVGFQEKIVVEGNEVNESYLLQMSSFIFNLALEYQPSTIRNHYDLIKTQMTTSAYNFYEEDFKRLIDDVELGQISSAFFMNSVKHDAQNKLLMVSGIRKLFLENEVVQSEDISYGIKYKIDYGRVFVEEIGMLEDLKKTLSANKQDNSKK